MRTREQVLEYGLSLPDTYQDALFGNKVDLKKYAIH